MPPEPPMTLTQQILWGSLYLGLCMVVEIGLLIWCNRALRGTGTRTRGYGRSVRATLLIAVAVAFIVLAHTVQVWIWAGAWMLSDVLPDWNSALYFSLVSYTTLGYGDIVLGPGLRIFASFSAVAGLLAFGLSTAYLVGLMTRMFEEDLRVF